MKKLIPIVACWACAAAAQTGQTLIANPLLSPNKIKEVKRQIMEAGHQELAPQLAMPVTPSSASGAPGMANMGFPAGPGAMGMPMPSAPATPESIRRALANLRVMAIVGRSALLAPDLPAVPHPDAQGPSYANALPDQAMPMGMPPGQAFGGPPGQQAQYGAPPRPQTRRGTSVTVRNGMRTYVDGFDVTALVEGDTVRLVMASTPGETVFQGQVQPAIYSPAGHPGAANLEKSDSTYLSNNKPDAASMSNPNGAGTSMANQPSVQNQQPFNSSGQPYQPYQR